MCNVYRAAVKTYSPHYTRTHSYHYCVPIRLAVIYNIVDSHYELSLAFNGLALLILSTH